MSFANFYERFEEFVAGLILLIPGILILIFCEIGWLLFIAFLWVFIVGIWCIISFLRMIPWVKLFIIAVVIFPLIWIVYFSLPDETIDNLPEWVDTIVGTTIIIALIAIYILHAVVTIVIELTKSTLNSIKDILFPTKDTWGQHDNWFDRRE